MRIGLLEDDIATQEMFVLMLQEEGYTVVNYNSAQECLAALGVTGPVPTELPVDMMLIDWHLEDSITGLEVCQRIRSTLHLHRLPIILTTAATVTPITRLHLQHLQVALLEKPFAIDDVVALFHRVASQPAALDQSH
jgi:two-component system chemotaxis response regulator CheY